MRGESKSHFFLTRAVRVARPGLLPVHFEAEGRIVPGFENPKPNTP